MSELVYVEYLKEVNKNLVDNGVELNLDFEIGTTHIIDQLNVLEQYLLLNDLTLQVEQEKGISTLLGFPEMTEDVWQTIHDKEEREKLKRIKQQNKLFERGTPSRIAVITFNNEDIKDYVEPEPEIEEDLFDTWQEENTEDLVDFDELDEEKIQEEDANLKETTDFSFSFETKDEGESEPEPSEETDLFADEGTNEDEEDESLLSNVFSDLQKAQALFNDDEGIDFKDEYAILDEDLSDYKSMTKADNDDDEIDESAEEDENSEDSTERFSFETPTFQEETEINEGNSFDFDSPLDFNTQGTDYFDNTPSSKETPPNSNQMNRDEVLTDKMVDKTTDVINKGLNALLKRIAK